MAKKIQYVVATTGRENLDFFDEMNISAPAIVTNQCGAYGIEEKGETVLVSTPTKGVGINRNLGLSLSDAQYAFIVDDDMVFYDNADSILNDAIQAHPDADVIIFGFDYMKGTEKLRDRMKRSQKINFFNCLNYGICCALVKTEKIRQKNISFTTFFGGGCVYGSGEDSLFYLECVRKKLKVYTCATAVGMNQYRESTWFSGYDCKFFYDKGAWIACAFPKVKHLIKWYFALRFKKRTELKLGAVMRAINQGIKGFQTLAPYNRREENEA